MGEYSCKWCIWEVANIQNICSSFILLLCSIIFYKFHNSFMYLFIDTHLCCFWFEIFWKVLLWNPYEYLSWTCICICMHIPGMVYTRIDLLVHGNVYFLYRQTVKMFLRVDYPNLYSIYTVKRSRHQVFLLFC